MLLLFFFSVFLVCCSVLLTLNLFISSLKMWFVTFLFQKKNKRHRIFFLFHSFFHALLSSHGLLNRLQTLYSCFHLFKINQAHSIGWYLLLLSCHHIILHTYKLIPSVNMNIFHSIDLHSLKASLYYQSNTVLSNRFEFERNFQNISLKYLHITHREQLSQKLKLICDSRTMTNTKNTKTYSKIIIETKTNCVKILMNFLLFFFLLQTATKSTMNPNIYWFTTFLFRMRLFKIPN